MLDGVRELSERRAAVQSDWVAALRAAVESGETLQAVADAAGITRGRVSQIVGPTGRKAGRRAPVVTVDEDALRAELAFLDGRWDLFVTRLAERYMPPENERRSEQAWRNGQNARAARQSAGVTRTGKASGASAWKSRRRLTVTQEAERAATIDALRYLEENATHPVCVRILAELDRAAVLREQVEAIDDSRVAFLHD